MNTELEKLLNFDPVAAAEARLGDASSDDDVAYLTFTLLSETQRARESLLRATNDTYFGAPLKYQLDTIESMGFRKVLEEPVGETSDRFFVYWRAGVLLVCESYRETSLNGGTAYFNYEGPREHMCGCGSAPIEGAPDVYAGSVDIREGLRFRLDRLTEYGSLLPHWLGRPFLWLLNYEEAEDYKEINKSRIAKLPQEVQDAITPGTQRTQQ